MTDLVYYLYSFSLDRQIVRTDVQGRNKGGRSARVGHLRVRTQLPSRTGSPGLGFETTSAVPGRRGASARTLALVPELLLFGSRSADRRAGLRASLLCLGPFCVPVRCARGGGLAQEGRRGSDSGTLEPRADMLDGGRK